ncbi:hypothetical protein ETB97_005335 [Aspergillus alliaceus]|uniref:Uncharacterized protein n=1 Tax=Petromyces alliaceus TaxID=209559 RepID=A0A8H6EA16_PETAA|nr:hypothetical protein ETB97_005335 [Aspergillus burnettii]
MPLLMPASTFGSLLPMPAAPSVTVAEGVLMMTTFGNHVLAFAPTFSTLQDATPAPSRANCYALAQADLTPEDLTSVTMYRTNRILRTFHFAPLPPEADVAPSAYWDRPLVPPPLNTRHVCMIVYGATATLVAPVRGNPELAPLPPNIIYRH